MAGASRRTNHKAKEKIQTSICLKREERAAVVCFQKNHGPRFAKKPLRKNDFKKKKERKKKRSLQKGKGEGVSCQKLPPSCPKF